MASRGEVIPGSEVILHRSYSVRSFDGVSLYDVALVRLSRASVQPTVEVTSPHGPSERALWRAGVNATTIGWGRTESGFSSDVPRKVVVPVLDDATPARGDWYGSTFGSAARSRSYAGRCDVPTVARYPRPVDPRLVDMGAQ